MNLALRQWRETFAQEPVAALDRLVRGTAPLGTASQLSLGEVLSVAFEPDDPELDAAVAEWLDGYILAPIPDGMIPSRWSGLLAEFFRGIAGSQFSKTASLFHERHEDLRLWLRGLYEGPDRDPEGAYLTTLAYCQTNRKFSPLWRRIILGEVLDGGRPHWFSTGMLGFRKMPDEEGQPAGDAPEGLLHALVDLADHKRSSKAHKAQWQQAIRSLFAAYLSSAEYWVERFREIMEASQESNGNFHHWIGEILPGWGTRAESVERNVSERSVSLPSYEEFQSRILRIKRDPAAAQSTEGEHFLNRYRSYTRATGNAYKLVRTFNQVSKIVAARGRQQAEWALSLIEEALEWERDNPVNWTVYAGVLSNAGRREEALRALWNARYRFPWDTFIRNELGRMLREKGDLETSEAVLREAAAHFPNNVVCLTSLAETLRAGRRLEEARGIFEKTCRNFPNNVVCRTGLGDVLIELNELDEAERVFDEARSVDPENSYAETGLAKVWFVRSAQAEDEELREKSRELLREFAARGNKVAESRLAHFDDWWAEGVAMGADFRGANTDVAEEPSPEPGEPATAESMSEAERLGRAMVALWRAERADGPAERNRLCNRALELLEMQDRGLGDLLSGFVETRGLVLLAQDKPREALDYFMHQIESLGRGGWIGIRLGEIRARIALGESVDTEDDEALFNSKHARFAFQVAEVLSRLDNSDPAHEELALLLKKLYPRAARMAAPEPSEEEAEETPKITDVSHMFGRFVYERWFYPAGVREKGDLDDPAVLVEVANQIVATRQDAADLLSKSVPALRPDRVYDSSEPLSFRYRRRE